MTIAQALAVVSSANRTEDGFGAWEISLVGPSAQRDSPGDRIQWWFPVEPHFRWARIPAPRRPRALQRGPRVEARSAWDG